METLMNSMKSLANVLTRSEMKQIMAGLGCASGTMTCEEFHKETGCYPVFSDPNSTCEGTDGCTYNSASSSGSCEC